MDNFEQVLAKHFKDVPEITLKEFIESRLGDSDIDKLFKRVLV